VPNVRTGTVEVRPVPPQTEVAAHEPLVTG
jgi:hypothetical protein